MQVYNTLSLYVCASVYAQFSKFSHYLFRCFIAFIAYCVVGMVVMRVKYDKTGTDVIPNKGLWFDIPSLVKVRENANILTSVLKAVQTLYFYHCFCLTLVSIRLSSSLPSFLRLQLTFS